MATYREIHGVNLQYRESDATAIIGDVWYNATTAVLKMFSSVGSWSSGGALNGTKAGGSSAGTQTAALAFGCAEDSNNCESYDGSSWTQVADTNEGRNHPLGCGTQTAALYAGGTPSSTSSEEFDGTSWTEGNDLNTG